MDEEEQHCCCCLERHLYRSWPLAIADVVVVVVVVVAAAAAADGGGGGGAVGAGELQPNWLRDDWPVDDDRPHY